MVREAAGGLDLLLPQVSSWFRATFGTPTPPQSQGWPAIARGENTLILAPTGSGKTLAAFLACLDHLWRTPRTTPGVRILYVSPLKALNQDIERNLQVPLEGVAAQAESAGSPLPRLRVAVRTGDTPAADRQRLVRKPPDILITTPESLHLMLTSKARETLKSVSHVIIDEIHALCPNKRGVFLALLLERLEAINPAGFVRIGLSATQRPLEEVARYLGGLRQETGADGSARLVPRPVTIVDTGQRKELDLLVTSPGMLAATQMAGSGLPPAGSVWPAIEAQLYDLISQHRSTIVFANNRRVVERVTAHLNELASSEIEAQPLVEAADEHDPDALSDRTIARAHHGSLNLERRRATEEMLKQGELPAVVATASLELGIDMGAVDLVCQVESPGSVARGLQRVGRAGHLVGQASKGRMIAKTSSDLLESAALAKAMLHGEVEALRVPVNCLDVLAQQVIACAAVDRWNVSDLLQMVRGAYPYRNLTAQAFESVLELVSGRFQAPGAPLHDLRPRVSWDRIHNRLHPLPGSARLALVGGGAIPDTGQYPLYLGVGGPRLGELDEEFVFERRVGETFVLGTSTWRIESIDPQRVIVSPAEGRSALAPFWRGENAPRTYELGNAVGALCRELANRRDEPGVLDWLETEYRLDPHAARSLRSFIARQVAVAGAVPDDRTVLVEAFRDPAGELGLAVLTPFGGKLHMALKLVLQALVRKRLGISAASLHGDDGVLIRLPQTDDPPMDILAGLTAEKAEALIREELGESALFGLRFRQNAGRALLMPRPDPGKRTPLWLQRLRAKDLLQIARQFPSFPVVVETYRQCLDDDLDLPHLREFLDGIAAGAIRVVTRKGEVPSPFASEPIFRFTGAYLYEWDEPRRSDFPDVHARVDTELLAPLLDPANASRWLEPGAVGRLDARLRGVGQPPRSVAEMAEWLRRLGDLAPDELAGPMLGFLETLRSEGRAETIELPSAPGQAGTRWIGTEESALFGSAFAEAPDEHALATIVDRYLRTHALVGLSDLTARYPIEPALAGELLERWAEEGRLVRLQTDDSGGPQWAETHNLQEMRRLSLALQRRESVAVPPEVFADFVARRLSVHPATLCRGAEMLASMLSQMQGFAAPASLWESELLPRRFQSYHPAWLDELFLSGLWTWRAQGEGQGEPLVAIAPRNFTGGWPAAEGEEPLSDDEARLVAQLAAKGASYVADLALQTGMDPSQAREGLRALVHKGRVTNDRFDPLRASGSAMAQALAEANGNGRGPRRRPSPGRPRLAQPPTARRFRTAGPEGRWSLVEVPSTESSYSEESLLDWAFTLLDRYGVLCRETVALDPWAPPWRLLAPVLARAEWRGDLRRGYFVEGLSGVQYALREATDELADLAGEPATGPPEPFLICSLDPANVYGIGAPFDIPLLEGGTARLSRTASNFLVMSAGRPVLIIEGNGKRLTGLPLASAEELNAALALVPNLAGPARKVLKVETFNETPALASPAAERLAELGFVRDHPGMAYYAKW